ncbi:hypothetical protein OROMI_008848 [Orobanche minor]
MKMHQAKAENAEKKMYRDHHGLYGHHRHRPEGGHLGHHEPVGATLPPTGGVAPTYPLGGGHRTGWTDPK